MCEWLIKDYKAICHNLQNKLTPYKVSDRQLLLAMREIKEKLKCDELTAWKALKTRLEAALQEKRKNECQ